MIESTYHLDKEKRGKLKILFSPNTSQCFTFITSQTNGYGVSPFTKRRKKPKKNSDPDPI